MKMKGKFVPYQCVQTDAKRILFERSSKGRVRGSGGKLFCQFI